MTWACTRKQSARLVPKNMYAVATRVDILYMPPLALARPSVCHPFRPLRWLGAGCCNRSVGCISVPHYTVSTPRSLCACVYVCVCIYVRLPVCLCVFLSHVCPCAGCFGARLAWQAVLKRKQERAAAKRRGKTLPFQSVSFALPNVLRGLGCDLVSATT